MTRITIDDDLPDGSSKAELRYRIAQPEVLLLDAMLELAWRRVTFVLDFAERWEMLRQAEDYEFQRANCHFHLQWIFDDEPSECFTFRSICQFSKIPAMQEVEPARERIRLAFTRQAAEEVIRPVEDKVANHVECAWLADPTHLSLPFPDEPVCVLN